MDSLVSTQWLADEMGASDLRIVDATAFLPEHGRVPRLEYEACHIPGAVFMDLAELVDAASPVPNTLPSAEKFASRMQTLGLGDGSRAQRMGPMAEDLKREAPGVSDGKTVDPISQLGLHHAAIGNLNKRIRKLEKQAAGSLAEA